MSQQYSLYPTTSAAGAAVPAGATATPKSLLTRGRSSTSMSMSSVSLSKGSTGTGESRRDSKDSKASVVSRKDWLKAPLPDGITIGGRGMWVLNPHYCL